MPKKVSRPNKSKKVAKPAARQSTVLPKKKVVVGKKTAPMAKTSRAKVVSRSTATSSSKSTVPSSKLTNQHLIVMFLICLILFLLTISRVGL